MNRFVLHSWVCLLALATPCLAQPSEVSYQGELKKDGLPYTGIAQMKFAIVDAEGDSLWSNDGTSVAGAEPASGVDVDATNGIFAVRLGAIPMSPIDGGMLKGVTQAALRVWVNTGEGFEQLTDMPISSSAFALSGEKCLEIGDLQINVVPRWDGAALSPGSIVDDGTNVGIGTTTPAARLDVAGAIRSSTGGFQFPDGSVQTTAVTGGGSGVPSGAMILTESPTSPDGYEYTGMSARFSKAQPWVSLAPTQGTYCRFGAAVEFGGKIYAFGPWNGAATLASVEEYDPDVDTWVSKSSMPAPRSYFGAAAAGAAIYIVAGINSDSGTLAEDVLRFDPQADDWTTVTSLPTPRTYAAVASVSGRIYVIGGADISHYVSTTDIGI